MRNVMKLIEQRTEAFAELPLYQFMRDTSIDARQRLSYIPAAAHFVMSFADLYALVFREEPAKDRYQELVNAHTYEDGGHWKWFLADLEKLGHDPRMPFTDALRFVWSDATVKMRMLTYHMCHLGIGADSLHKLVLVQCIEATGAVSLKHTAMVAKELTLQSGKNLVYVGAHHFETESEHTLEQDEVHRTILAIELAPEVSRDLMVLVNRSFDLFTDLTDDVLRFAKSGARVGPA